MNIGSGSASNAEDMFRRRLTAMDRPRVLEMGTLRWEADRPTHHLAWAPHASEFVMTDVDAGTDVDVVSDAHTMSRQVPGTFDAVISVSVWEHLKRPWIAAQEVAKVLNAGGIAFVCTHHTFPLHGYPHDYFRFSDAALATMFEDAGMVTMDAGYQYPCRIIPPSEVTRWNTAAESYLNVAWSGYKP
jgi:SAM-dependent methyltransferase